jgi:CHAT domain-containing protein
MGLIIVAILLLASAQPLLVYAQQAESGDALVARGRQLYGEQGPKAALAEFEKALRLFQEAKDRRGEALALGYIGLCHNDAGEYPLALEFLQKSLAMKRELGERLEASKTLSNLGLTHWNLGEYPKAIEALNESMTIARSLGEKQVEAAALTNLGLVYDEQGDFRRSLEHHQRALELFRAVGFARGESAALGNLGGVHLLLGRYREALPYYQQALALSQKHQLKPSATQDLGNIALCLAGLGRLPEALEHFDRALALAREAGLRKEEADWRKGKGTALVRMGRYSAALEEYRIALESYDALGLKRERVEGLYDRGTLHALLGDAASAEKDFRAAIALAESIGHARGVTMNLLALGDLEWRRERRTEAEALYRQALARARDAGDAGHAAAALLQLSALHRRVGRFEEAAASAEEARASAHQSGALLQEAEALYALGEARRIGPEPPGALAHFAAAEEIAARAETPELVWRSAYGRGQTFEKLRDFEAAIAAYRRAVEVIEEVRGQLREERFRAGYIEDKYEVYVALVRLLLRLNRVDEAFLFAEKLRARNFLDLLSRGLPPLRDPALRQAETELQQRIRQLRRALERESVRPPEERRADALRVYSLELAEAERAYQALLDQIWRAEPAYAAARALAAPSAQEVQSLLAEDAAMVHFVVAPEEVAIFVLTRRELRATSVPLRAADLRARVELLRDLIDRERTADWQRPAESLGRALFAPLEAQGWLRGVRRIYLVPHGILHYLPFAALLRPVNGELRPLVEDYELAYLPAAAALARRAGEERRPEKSVLALAPANSRLQFAAQEAQRVAEFFQPARTVLLGRRATETAFRREAAGHRVVHLATHGRLNRMNPLFSSVQLEEDGEHDGRLEVHEILALRMNAQLVTLSACETALGGGYFTEIPAGDDLVGLTRAFLYAGSQSVLASLWEVNDRSTLDLMSNFYRHLRESDKVTALTQAQRAMRQSRGRHSHPYFWAPFILAGEMR